MDFISQQFPILRYRHIEIFYYKMCGYSNKEMADLMFISERTVKAHLSNLISLFPDVEKRVLNSFEPFKFMTIDQASVVTTLLSEANSKKRSTG